MLRSDRDVRELYLAAVVSRVLGVPWSDAMSVAVGGDPLPSSTAVQAFADELTNPTDAGARWCSVIMLARSRECEPATTTNALIRALRSEHSRENVRAIGLILGGQDPLGP